MTMQKTNPHGENFDPHALQKEDGKVITDREEQRRKWWGLVLELSGVEISEIDKLITNLCEILFFKRNLDL